MFNSFFPPWRGGAETYTYNLARQLVIRGQDVNVFCANPPSKPGTYKVEGIELSCLPVRGWLYGTPLMTKLPLRLLQVRADIFHAGFPRYYNAFCTSIASRFTGTPSALTWHNDLPSVTPMAGALVEAHDAFVLPTYIQTFGRIISTSGKYAKSSQILRRYAWKVDVVPNGVDCKRFRPDIDPGPVREKLNLGGVKTILFVGALSKWHRYKGLDVLIHAFALVKRVQSDIVLLVVGDGTLRASYQELTSHLNLERSVIFAGDVSDEELPRYYAASDLLILPSRDRSEGFGLTILEANTCGIPAVGSEVGGIPEVIRHRFNGLLVPPGNPEALASAITHLLEEDSVRIKMGRNGRVFAEEHDWSRVAAATEKVYRKILNQREPSL